ncbi:YdcF family protein [Ramlibacter tataouinensis]|uniref:DUF218 domain-containing protein n=1 Tax=Ramlibacter tataouinensis (strain ATCC BAA-407 / DSM 14655 / LMG 21543 / TTB310) TaxID=365046 RepID=F5Y0X2_RAMTT|nr:YdcF family protein [Ramlibacter tataouinensis]AEG92190.1 conserved hypothetical protein [Ramlibacter tataouinensis TTB310]
MQAGEIKTFLAAVVLPPSGPLLLALLGLALAWARRRLGLLLGLAGLALLWALSSHAVAVALARQLLPPVRPVTAAELRAAGVQAVVVLGGGVLPQAPEYGQAQPSANTWSRLRYGVRLARATGLPLGFSGGVAWSALGTAAPSEAEVARRAAGEDFGADLRWVEGRSRDTAENAQQMRALMRRDGVDRIALVTDTWQLPRAVVEFRRAGFEVLPAPTGFVVPRERPALEWLPSGQGLAATRQILREWLALQAAT